MMIDSYVRIKS